MKYSLNIICQVYTGLSQCCFSCFRKDYQKGIEFPNIVWLLTGEGLPPDH